MSDLDLMEPIEQPSKQLESIQDSLNQILLLLKDLGQSTSAIGSTANPKAPLSQECLALENPRLMAKKVADRCLGAISNPKDYLSPAEVSEWFKLYNEAMASLFCQYDAMGIPKSPSSPSAPCP